jgi:hypothetical protein
MCTSCRPISPVSFWHFSPRRFFGGFSGGAEWLLSAMALAYIALALHLDRVTCCNPPHCEVCLRTSAHRGRGQRRHRRGNAQPKLASESFFRQGQYESGEASVKGGLAENSRKNVGMVSNEPDLRSMSVFVPARATIWRSPISFISWLVTSTLLAASLLMID